MPIAGNSKCVVQTGGLQKIIPSPRGGVVFFALFVINWNEKEVDICCGLSFIVIWKVCDGMSDNNKLTTGILILAAGIVILLGKLGVFSFLGKALWPLILLVPGIIFHLWHFWRKGPSELLLPGGILVVYSILFFIANFWGWHTFKYTWPGLILGIAVGLYEYEYFSKMRQSGVLLAAVILAAVSVICFGFTLFSLALIYVVAIVLIAVGTWLIAARGKTRRNW
ncbi:hypothetical protein LBW89_08320 [Paenibacillus sp. alder61]|nr:MULTISPECIES: hypothetical protein [Paenibacillus]MCA1293021.1 hypothetical protein [Paenibacillus sp. alder61]